jgi:hypothetical protein
MLIVSPFFPDRSREYIMRNLAISFVLIIGTIATSACNKKPSDIGPASMGEVTPESASPNESLATVTISDGTHYQGALISKTGSQLTFRGKNGAMRTFDSQDIKTIRFADVGRVSASSDQPAGSAGLYPSTVSLQNPVTASEPIRRRGVLPSGTLISVRNNEVINSGRTSAGQTFSAIVARDVIDDSGAVAIPRGSAATLIVREAGAGKIHANDLGIELTSLAVGGIPRNVQTGVRFQKGRDGVGANKRTAEFAGGGAAVGALIGGLIGGGRGAAIGAGSGAGAGAGTQILTRGSVKIPSESLLSFTLEAPLAL